MATAAKSRFATANGLRLHYLDHGGAGKPPLVCLHGLNANAHMFDQIAPALCESHRVLAMDFRGHGDSQWGSPSEYDALHYLRDFTGFLTALNISKLSIIGSSLGGVVGMLLAATYAGRVDKLILNDVGAEIDPAGLCSAALRPSLTEAEFDSIADAVAYYRRSYPPAALLSDPVAAQTVMNSVRTTQSGRLRWKTDPAAVAAFDDGGPGTPPPLWSFYERVRARVLIVRGADSDILSPGTVAKMLHVLPRAEAVEVPGVGHTPWLSEPVAMARLRDFLRSEAGAGETLGGVGR